MQPEQKSQREYFEEVEIKLAYYDRTYQVTRQNGASFLSGWERISRSRLKDGFLMKVLLHWKILGFCIILFPRGGE
jgi:hypothetical protein